MPDPLGGYGQALGKALSRPGSAMHWRGWAARISAIPERDSGMAGPGGSFLGEDDTLGAADGQRQRLNGPTSD